MKTPQSDPCQPPAMCPPSDAPASLISSIPMGALLLRDAPEDQFDTIVASWISQFDPNDLLGRMHAEMVILAAQRLRKAARFEPEGELPGLDWCRFHTLAERNYRNACKDLKRHLDQQAAAHNSSSIPRSSARSRSAAPAEPVETPPLQPPESTPEEIADAFANWRKHIALVRSMSEEWPVILRLRREVEDVAAWLADGKTEEELMTWYPGLTRADIAACRACDAEGLCGPFDPADGPYPPGLPVLDTLPEEQEDSG